MLASAHGILGQQALKDRDNTEEGRARKVLHYQRIAKALQGHPLRRRRRPAADMRFAQFAERRWMSVFSPMQSLYDSLAVEDFSTEKPKDRGRYITECPACGDRPITSGNSKHECSTNGGFISIAKVPNVKKSRCLTVHEMLSDRVHGLSIHLESFSEHGLAHLPSTDFISPTLIMPHMLPAQQDAFNASFVVHRADVAVPRVFCEYQAYENLIRASHTESDDDLVWKGVHDKSITGEVARVLSGAVKNGKILRIRCRTHACPQVQLGTEGCGQKRLPRNPQHSPIKPKHFPDRLPSWIGDRDRITRVTDSLKLHTKGKHTGLFDRYYESFWDLPLTVKRAMLMANYYEDMVLGKNNNLRGLAVTLMNWRSPA